MRPRLAVAIIALLVVAGLGFQVLQAPTVSENPLAQTIFTYDVLIKNAVIVDGSGDDRYYGSIGILGDKITAVGPTLSGWARRVIDAKGLYATPGFIDLGPLPVANNHKLSMGVTTQVIRSLETPPRSTATQGTNLAWLVDLERLSELAPGGTGSSTATLSKETVERLSDALRTGASGTYLQGSSPLAALLRENNTLWSALAAEKGRLFWQMPTDDPYVKDKVTGLLARASAYQVPIHLSGVNLSNSSLWGRVYDIINLVDRGEVRAVSGDVTPYFELPQVAERDLLVFVSHPALAVASGADSQHPAITGAFPRLLQRFVNQEAILSMEEAIHKVSQLPASVLGLSERGRIHVGYYADLVLFDGIAITANSASTPASPVAHGIHMVFVNGKLAVDAGKITGEQAGMLLTRYPQP